MLKPYIMAAEEEEKERKVYKKLLCHSIIGKNLDDNFGIAITFVIKDNKKVSISHPFGMERKISIKDFIKELKKDLKDIYVDENGISVINDKEHNTIDVYFEKY